MSSDEDGADIGEGGAEGQAVEGQIQYIQNRSFNASGCLIAQCSEAVSESTLTYAEGKDRGIDGSGYSLLCREQHRHTVRATLVISIRPGTLPEDNRKM